MIDDEREPTVGCLVVVTPSFPEHYAADAFYDFDSRLMIGVCLKIDVREHSTLGARKIFHFLTHVGVIKCGWSPHLGDEAIQCT